MLSSPRGVEPGRELNHVPPTSMGNVTDCLRLVRRVRPGRAGLFWEAIQPSAGERNLPKNDSPGSSPRFDRPIWNKCTFSINCLYFSFKERRGRKKKDRKQEGYTYM